jgi:hypothetical protein
MKKLEWIHRNKAKIETGHKTYDRQCVALMTGNVVGPGQHSSYIRPVSQTRCNEMDFPVGNLRAYDLQAFPGLPPAVLKYLEGCKSQVILYKFSHFTHNPSCSWRRIEIVHGYVVTLTSNEDHRFLRSFVTGPTNKSWQVIDWCKDYISNP